MRTINFKNEFETAEAVIRFQMSNVRYQVVGRTSIVVEDESPLVLPTMFLRLLMQALAVRGMKLLGVSKRDKEYTFHITEKDIRMSGMFSVNDIMAKI